ncbi:MAG: SDR family NAD(P)-dependent oxidoreductase [Dehalococcoidia bacterium]|nr:MAG: SDR family NAD(P)-dependent oxidoreductase [Dehalococcoidia bacterium]
MEELRGKVAVITGAASGIGRAMAERFAAEGMKVVLADVEADALARAEAEMKAGGATVLAAVTDVSRAADVEALAGKTVDAFGAVHVLCNNAGVSPVMAAIWELTEADWQWVLGVNLWGVIHGIRAFVPIMLKQGSEGHIINTASAAGLVAGGPWWSTYGVSKHGVVNLSESLHRELAAAGSKVKVSVLCPAWVKTQLMDSDRNRPDALRNEPDHAPGASAPMAAMMEQAVRQFVVGGTDPSGIAALVVDAIRHEKFFIIPHPEWKEQIRARMEDILEERNPSINLAL